MPQKDPTVDTVLAKASRWRDEMRALRKIALSTGLDETLKWGQPCYVLGRANVVLIHGFKDYCALLLFKGALLKDPEGILVVQTENVQSSRQIRFTGLGQIRGREKVLESYIREAIEVEKSGAKVGFKSVEQFHVPEEFEIRLRDESDLKSAFEALTPGRRRAYLLHFAGAKQSRTRKARIEKCVPRILEGLGLDDSKAPST